MGLAKIVVPVAGVVLPEPLGNQSIDLHAEQFLTLVTEQVRGQLVDDDDVGRPIDDDDRIGRSFQKPFERHRARKAMGCLVRAILIHNLDGGLASESIAQESCTGLTREFRT
jgi:hypothetical protein